MLPGLQNLRFGLVRPRGAPTAAPDAAPTGPPEKSVPLFQTLKEDETALRGLLPETLAYRSYTETIIEKFEPGTPIAVFKEQFLGQLLKDNVWSENLRLAMNTKMTHRNSSDLKRFYEHCDLDFLKRLGTWISDHWDDQAQPYGPVSTFLMRIQEGAFRLETGRRSFLYSVVLEADGNRVTSFQYTLPEDFTPTVILTALRTGGDSLDFLRKNANRELLRLIERDLHRKYRGLEENQALEAYAARSSVRYAFITLYRLFTIVDAPSFDAASNRDWIENLATNEIATAWSAQSTPATRNANPEFVEMFVTLAEDVVKRYYDPEETKEEREEEYRDDMEQAHAKRARLGAARKMAADVHDRHVRGASFERW